MQFAERHHAGGGKALDGVGGLGGDPALEHLRAAGADLAGDVAEILVGDGQAVQRSQRKAGRPRAVGAIRHCPGCIGVDFREGVKLAVGPGDPVEQGIDDFPGRELPGSKTGGEFGESEGM